MRYPSMRSKSEAGDPIRRPYNYSSGSGSDDRPVATESAAADHQHRETMNDSVAINIAAESAIDASIELGSLPPPRAMPMGENRRRIRAVSSSTSPLLSAAERHKATLSLAFACLWPLLVLLLLIVSRHDGNPNSSSRNINYDVNNVGIGGNGEYDRMLMSPDGILQSSNKSRVAVVIVVPSPPPTPPTMSDELNHLQQTRRAILDNSALQAVESIFRTTHRHRIFVVVVVFDEGVGIEEKKLFDVGLREIDNAGRPPQRKRNEDSYHPEKIFTIYNTQSIGVSASRRKAVQFINVLAGKHEESGSKSKEEDLILLFLRCDAQLREFDGNKVGANVGDVADGRIWLDDVSDALLLTSSSDENEDGGGSRHARLSPPANAISLVIDYSSITDNVSNKNAIQPSKVGTTYSFDKTFHPIHSIASTQDMALANGMSYPTPLTGGAATALRLYTYNSLPSNDDGVVTNYYAADLELSFNLWMCADGIDILNDDGGGGETSRLRARVVVNPLVLSSTDVSELSGPMAARIVSAWMSGHDDGVYYAGILKAIADYSASLWWHSKVVVGRGVEEKRVLLDKAKEMEQTLVRIASEARLSPTFPSGLDKKCRPFSWYAQHVHTGLDFVEDGNKDGEAEEVNANNPHLDLIHQPVISKNADGTKILPSHPLDSARMAIISKASPVKLAYVDASGGHVAHPHMGATDENGVYGYIHDETALHNNPPQFTIKNDDERARLCKKGDPNYQMLTKKVFVDLQGHEAAERRAEHGLAKQKRVKIFCFVYTTEQNHDRVPAIHETWGQKCDGFMVASTKTDTKLGTVNIPHEGPEEYNNIWQKVRAMWSYIYDHYYEKYDYFHIGGDDLYLIVENLRLYLESEEIQLASNGGQYLPDGTEDSQTPLFLGRRFAEGGNRDRMFISGGSGYTMNKAALKTLVVDCFPECFPQMHTFSEDVMVATCLRKREIYPYDTKDEAGGERYMPFEPGHHLTYQPPANPKDDWYSNYSVDVKWGIDHCAAKSVAFHYIKGDLMRRMHAILYHHCG